jgi:hypothetical protein
MGMSGLLAVKLLASPALIGAASLAGKRWGPNAAGLLGGLPLVGGPVIWALWISHGPAVAVDAARAAPTGVWATLAYLVALGHLSAVWPWHRAIPAGWCVYLLSALALQWAQLAHLLWAGVLVIPALLLAATRLLPQPRSASARGSLPPAELLARMLAAVALVLTLTSATALIGAQMTGLLAGAPVAATVIPAFLLAYSGREALLHALRGFLTGLTGFVVFFLALGQSVASLGVVSVLAATVLALATTAAAARLVQRALRPVAPFAP